MQKVLSLCFPTYNRGWCMKEQIERLKQCPKELQNQIEIIISDNCSTDDTEEIVRTAMNEGFHCIYNKNRENLGMDGNFVTCFKMATGKYVWLLGDDDYIMVDSLLSIVDKLKFEENYGLVHIYNKKERFSDEPFIEYADNNHFARTISYYTTFISSNIVNTKYVPEIDFDKYMGTWFTLIPLYLTALIRENINLLVNFPVFESPKDFQRNGGYNFFKVFVKNYLDIWKEFESLTDISCNTFSYIKKDIYVDLIVTRIYNYLIKKERKQNIQVDNGWNIVLHYYGKNWYFYYYILKIIIIRKFYIIKKNVCHH